MSKATIQQPASVNEAERKAGFAAPTGYSHSHVVLEGKLELDGPRLEMFARRKRAGWHVWGNELTNDVEMPNDKLSDSRADNPKT